MSNAPALALVVRQVRRIDGQWLPRIALLVDAVEPGGDDAAQGQIRVGRAVDRFDLDVGRLRFAAPEGRGGADRGLPVVVTPARERRRPGARLEPTVRVVA